MHGLLGATIYTRKDVKLYRGTLYTIRATMCIGATINTITEDNRYRHTIYMRKDNNI